MRGEEIISCKSHITSVSLTDWCIMILFKTKLKIKKIKNIYAGLLGNEFVMFCYPSIFCYK